MDLVTGRTRLLIPSAEALRFPDEHGDWTGAKHWFNHLLFSPDGSGSSSCTAGAGREREAASPPGCSRPIADGRNLYVLDPYGRTSHFIWRDPSHVLAWAWHPSHGERFYLCEDRTRRVEVVGEGVMTVNGHCTYLPGNRWILNDTYPDKQRNQHPYLYNVESGKRYPLGHFHSPARIHRRMALRHPSALQPGRQ